jgi:hypothetical protein
MDPAAVGASAALLGSFVGALASFGSSWVIQRSESRRELRNRTIEYREKLYTDFINEASRRLTDALVHELRDGESNLSIEEVRSIELERPEQSLKDFSLACRRELEEILRSR